HRMPGEVEARPAPAVEHVDLRRVADAVEQAVEGDGVVHAQAAHLRLGHRRREIVVRHCYGCPSSDFLMSADTGRSPSQMRSRARKNAPSGSAAPCPAPFTWTLVPA